MRLGRIALAWIAGGLALCGTARGDNLEYAVKAAYLTKFVPFIDWPDDTFPSPAAPVTLCVLGDGPFGGRLMDDAAAVQGGRRLVVRHVDGADPSCQLLFVGADAPDAQGVLDALKTSPVVTVTDSGMAAAGIIRFVIAANHVRFDIDAAAAEARGLKISSKLLGLARKVMVQEGAP